MVEILRLMGNDAGRRAAAGRLYAGGHLQVRDDEDTDEAVRLRRRVAELESVLEARRVERSKLVGLLTQFLAARERELATWRRQLRDERTAANRKALELEAALEHEREERERDRAGHEAFVDGLRARHAEEWSKLDDERCALAAKIATPQAPRAGGWLSLFGR